MLFAKHPFLEIFARRKLKKRRRFSKFSRTFLEKRGRFRLISSHILIGTHPFSPLQLPTSTAKAKAIYHFLHLLFSLWNKENHKIQTAHLRTIENQLHCSLYLIPNGVNKHISRVSQMTQVDFNLITLANLNYFNAKALLFPFYSFTANINILTRRG